MSRAALSVIIFVIVGLALPAGTIVINLFAAEEVGARARKRTLRKRIGPYRKRSDRGLRLLSIRAFIFAFDIARFSNLASLIAPILSDTAFIAIFIFIIFVSHDLVRAQIKRVFGDLTVYALFRKK